MNTLQTQAIDARETQATTVDPVFPARWSPRAMSGEAMTLEELMPLVEAARWAPSAFNAQPWRIVYSLQGDDHWDAFLGLLVEPNRLWARKAGALLIFVSRTEFEHNDQPSPSSTYDTGAAWMSLALQASIDGFVAHGMAGFDYDRARDVAGLSAVFKVEAMAALGRPGNVADLPENYQAMEAPSPRKALEDIMVNGSLATD